MSSDSPEQTFGFLLNDVARLLRKRFEQKAKGLGLTRSQWQVIAYLAKNEGIQQGALAELLELEPITLGRILDRLEAAGYVERRPHPTDRRVWLLHTKPEVHPVLAQIRELGAETRSEASMGLSRADEKRLIEILMAMRCNLTAASTSANQAEPRQRHG